MPDDLPVDPFPSKGCGECFLCILTGLGFDSDQIALVIQLMYQAAGVGIGRVLASIFGPDGAREKLAGAPEPLLMALQPTEQDFAECLGKALELGAAPMSPEVAGMLRGHDG